MKKARKAKKAKWSEVELMDADPKCKHKIEMRWSGVRCSKRGGWFCY
jgi:hypothetical protein